MTKEEILKLPELTYQYRNGYKTKTYTIYAMVNQTNGKRYIGRTTNPRSRCKAHMNLIRSRKHQNITDYDDEYTFEILETDVEFPKCSHLERDYMLKYKTYKSEFGYNIKDKFFQKNGKPTRIIKEVI